MTAAPVTPDLVAAVRGGDRVAFEQLFRSRYALLAGYAARLTGSRDAAEDIVQEVFIGVWYRHDSLPDADKLGPYLHRSVRNRAINHIRDRRRTEPLPDGDDAGPALAPEVETGLDDADLAAALDAALAALPPRTREVFLLSREQHLTYNEIAVTLDISVKTVETLMGRALRALRATLAPRLRE
jgi:RNA polymerase sigma-70 factor (ECF subfamily)